MNGSMSLKQIEIVDFPNELRYRFVYKHVSSPSKLCGLSVKVSIATCHHVCHASSSGNLLFFFKYGLSPGLRKFGQS